MRFLHRLVQEHMQRLHGGGSAPPVAGAQGADFQQCYDDYAGAVANANAMLQQHGPGSAEFAQADVASMRLFHRVKKMQGLKNPRRKPG
jgi:hypothetical protein